MIVVDASAAVELLTGTVARVSQIQRQLAALGGTMHVPHLLDLEVANALRHAVLWQKLSVQEAEAALADFAQMPAVRYPHYPLLPRIWALRANLSVYDAAYVVLAETLGAPLLTADQRLASAPGHSATIRVV